MRDRVRRLIRALSKSTRTTRMKIIKGSAMAISKAMLTMVVKQWMMATRCRLAVDFMQLIGT